MNPSNNPEDFERSEHDQKQDKMDVFNAQLYKNRELLGEPTQSKIINFPFKKLKQMKNLPDKLLVHMQKAGDGGMFILIRNPNGTFNYVIADQYGKQ